MTTAAFFIDVNVFMYAVGAPHPYKQACVRVLADIETRVLSAAINTEIIQELLFRYHRLNVPDQGILICRTILGLPLIVLPVTQSDVALAIDLYDRSRTGGLQPRDAVHAATMQNNGLTRLISADRDFDALDTIVRVDPLAYVSEMQK